MGRLIAATLGRDMNIRRIIAVKLDGVGDQVLKQLNQLRGVGRYGREGGVRHHRAALLNSHSQIGEGVVENGIAVGGLKGFPLRVNPGISQQAVKHRFHPVYAVHGVGYKFVDTPK